MNLAMTRIQSILYNDRPPTDLHFEVKIFANDTTTNREVQSPRYQIPTGYSATGLGPLIWPLFRAPDWLPRYSPLYGNTRDAGGDDWCTAGVYRFLNNPDHRAMLVGFNDISGEHGRDLDHNSHKFGTDIDFVNPAPEEAGNATSGSQQYVFLQGQIQTAVWGATLVTRQTAIEQLRRWVMGSRQRLEGLLNRAEVTEIFYGQRELTSTQDPPTRLDESACLDALLRSGTCTVPAMDANRPQRELNLGLEQMVWGLDPLIDRKLRMVREHWNHFHLTFHPLMVQSEN